MLDRVAVTGSRELFTLTILVLALGIAVGSAKVFGVSMALGAFLAGLVVGRSDYSLRAASEALPMRDAFAVLFFVAVGMLLEPRYLIEAPGLIAATLAVVLVGKPLVAFLIVRLLRYPFRVAFAIAIALAQIGEFSFILANIGRDLGILTRDATNTLVAVSIVSIVLNPLLVSSGDAGRTMGGSAPAALETPQSEQSSRTARQPRRPPADRSAQPRRGRWIRSDRPDGHPAAPRQQHRADGDRIEHGNGARTSRAGRDGYLRRCHATRHPRSGRGADAGSLILTSAGMGNSADVIRMARDLNPAIRVLARAAYLRDLPGLQKAGADTVFTGEGEVALAFTEAILHRLGATPEQIDRERSRAHADLFGESAA